MPNKSCAFYSCKSNSRKDPTLKWTRFVNPRHDPERYTKWFERLKRPSYDVTGNTYVCEKHFPQGADLNKLTNTELIPEAETHPEICEPKPKRKIDEVIVFQNRTRGKQSKVPKLHYEEIQKPKRDPTIGELMKWEFNKNQNSEKETEKRKRKSTLWKCECSAKFQSKQEIINHIRRVHPDKVIDSFDLHAYENAIVFDAKLSKIVRHEIVMVNQAELSEDIEDKGEKLVLETPILWGDIEEDDTDPLSDSKCKAEVTDNPEFEDPLRIF